MFSIDPSTRGSDGLCVVTLRGELDVMDAASAAGELSAIAARGHLVIVDLAGLTFIDSSGLAALVLARKHARGTGGDLLLAAAQGQVLRFLDVSRLIDVVGVRACVADAAGSPELPQAGVPAGADPALLATP